MKGISVAQRRKGGRGMKKKKEKTFSYLLLIRSGPAAFFFSKVSLMYMDCIPKKNCILLILML